MNILITGAAGFIGSQIAYKLWKDGHTVVLIDNFSYGKEDNLIFSEKNFVSEIIHGDIRDEKLINKLISENKIEIIFHIAGIAPLPDCQSRPSEALDVNLSGTVKILESARKNNVKKIIFASTTAIYENDTLFPSKENSFELPSLIYANTKYCAERFCQSYCDTYGMNVTAVRFANVYGPHIDFLRKQPPFVGYMIRELLLNKVPTFYSDGNQTRDYIYIEDLLELLILIMHSSKSGFTTVNASTNKSYSVKEMFNIAKKITKKNIEAQFVSSKDFWNKYPELYEGQYPIKEEVLLHEVNKKTLCDNSLAFELYNWRPKTTMEAGLSKSILYIKEALNKLNI